LKRPLKLGLLFVFFIAQLSFAEEIKTFFNIHYGDDKKQSLDVYAPMNAQKAPVIFMVHGGAWSIGDKAMSNVVENKVNHWVKKGFIVISTNYRLLPQAPVSEQAKDIAYALSFAQQKASQWGGDETQFILMGHSAGAHLVALIGSTAPILGTVVLDSAALDVVDIMSYKHAKIYDRIFGSNHDYWKSVSPAHALTKNSAPLFIVCSTKRDISCSQAETFVNKAISMGIKASLIQKNMTHQEINETLGKDTLYTKEVDQFLRSLNSHIDKRLTTL